MQERCILTVSKQEISGTNSQTHRLTNFYGLVSTPAEASTSDV